MGFLKIHCGQCQGTWEVYNRDDWHDVRSRTCPHCFAMIAPQMWRQISIAFAEMEDVNCELLKEHLSDRFNKHPLTRVDYVADIEKTRINVERHQ